MARSLYVSILLALALAGHSEAAATGVNGLARRQQGGVAHQPFSTGFPIGSGGAFSSSSSIQSESHSFSTVMETYNGLLGNIQNCQSAFGQTGFTSEIATQQIHQVATQFQAAFSQFNACGSCISGNQLINFRETFSKLFSSFHSLVEKCQERFPTDWQPLFGGSFRSLNDNFHQFFTTCQNGGLEVHQFVPQQLTPFFQEIGMNSACSSCQQGGISSSSSSSFHSESSSHTESHSVQGVMGEYNGLLGQIKSCQGAFAQSGFTQETATQHIQELATQFQSAFSRFHGCGACSGQDIQSFRGVFSELFTSFHTLVNTCEERFPNNWQHVFGGSFGSLNEDFSKFFSTCQSSGLPVNTFFPQQLGSFFSKVQMTSTASTLKKVGYSF